jgi:hypothetical protein
MTKLFHFCVQTEKWLEEGLPTQRSSGNLFREFARYGGTFGVAPS